MIPKVLNPLILKIKDIVLFAAKFTDFLECVWKVSFAYETLPITEIGTGKFAVI